MSLNAVSQGRGLRLQASESFASPAVQCSVHVEVPGLHAKGEAHVANDGTCERQHAAGVIFEAAATLGRELKELPLRREEMRIIMTLQQVT